MTSAERGIVVQMNFLDLGVCRRLYIHEVVHEIAQIVCNGLVPDTLVLAEMDFSEVAPEVRDRLGGIPQPSWPDRVLVGYPLFRYYQRDTSDGGEGPERVEEVFIRLFREEMGVRLLRKTGFSGLWYQNRPVLHTGWILHGEGTERRNSPGWILNLEPLRKNTSALNVEDGVLVKALINQYFKKTYGYNGECCTVECR